MSNNDGKKFEEDLENSARKQNIFHFRVRDVNPQALKSMFAIPKNKYDFLLYHNYRLFPMELKSTKGKSFSFEGNNPKIKPHQIKALTEDSKYEGVICGLLLNFREPDNKTFFIHIDDFNTYREIAAKKIKGHYKSKTNEKSIPLRICEEIGHELVGIKKRTRHTYLVKELFDGLIKKYG